MSRRLRQRCLAAALATLASLVVRPALGGGSRDACFDSYVEVQRLRNAGKLRAALERLSACVDPKCPAFVHKECGQWLDDVQARIAAVVLSAGAQGTAGTKLAIFIDGEPASDWTDGRAIPIDPGPHEVRAELDGHSVQQHIVVPEGNKAFPVVIDTKALAPPSPAPPAPPALTAPTAPPALTALTAPTAPPVIPATAGNEAPKSSGLRAPTYVLGGVALVGLASFVGFALAGESAQSCAPSCSRSQISTVRRDYAVADVSLLAALAAGGGALYFALTSKPEASGATSAARRTTAWWLGVRVEGGGPWLGGGTTF